MTGETDALYAKLKQYEELEKIQKAFPEKGIFDEMTPTEMEDLVNKVISCLSDASYASSVFSAIGFAQPVVPLAQKIKEIDEAVAATSC